MRDQRSALQRHAWLPALVLVLILVVPALRLALESSMSRHMLVQMPLLMLAGWAGGYSLGPARRQRWRELAGGGLPLVLIAVFASSYWMLPRAVDAVLDNAAAEVAKFLTLPLLIGLPLALGWEALGAIGRGFVLTNFFSMLVVVGWLYLAAPLRICNRYLESEQQEVGYGMVVIAVAALLCWLLVWILRPAPGDGYPPDSA